MHPTPRFFYYSQNNSGGHFDFDKSKGITHHVIIEAFNADEANRRAEDIGLYWNGVDAGRDCECCGDRWYPAWDNKEGEGEPCVYDTPVAKVSGLEAWMKPGHEIAVHYLDGSIKWHGV